MAWDLTKPSMTDPTLAAAFGNIRENFRALAQDDWAKTAGNLAVGGATSASVRLRVIGASATSSDFAFAAQDSGGNNILTARDDGGVGIGGALFSTGLTKYRLG